MKAGYCTAGPIARALAHRAARSQRQQQEDRGVLETLCEKYPLVKEATRKSA